MRAPCACLLLCVVLSPAAVAADAGPAADAAAADAAAGDAGPAGDDPLAKARALADAGDVEEAVTTLEAALVRLGNEELGQAYCQIATLLSGSDSGTSEEARARVQRYVEACLARRPTSEDAIALALRYKPELMGSLPAEQLREQEARLRALADKGEADDVAKRHHRTALLYLSHVLRNANQDAEAEKAEAELKKRYDEGGEATCLLAEASFARWYVDRSREKEMTRAQELMSACLAQQPERRDMPGLYNDLLIYRYARPALLVGSVLLLLVAGLLAMRRKKKDGAKDATSTS